MHFWNRESVAEGLEQIALCRGPLLSELTRLLNEFHHREKSERYYDILAGDWLEFLAHIVFAAMVETGGPGATATRRPIPVFTDPHTHVLRWQSDRLSERLRWAVATLLKGGSPAKWEFESNSATIASGGRERFAARMLKVVATPRPGVLLVSPYFRGAHRETAGVLWRWRRWARWDNLHYPVQVSAMVDQAWRKRYADAVVPVSDLAGLLRVLLPLYLPVALLEGFKDFRAAVLAMPVSRPRVAYSANALHHHLTFKLLAAEWMEEGTRLLYHQHGGGYGIDKAHAVEEFETRVADRFFTFGWTNGNPKVRPLSPAGLNAPRSVRKHFLLSCVDFPKVVYRLHFHPMPGTIQTMHRETSDFLVALPDHGNLMVRPYMHDYGWGFSEMMRRAAPEAAFDDRSVGALIRYAQSRLVVHNYLGTGWLETLALDIPTVCFFDSDTYAFRDDARPWIDALERVGILHRAGGAAARFVSGLGNDPEGWWSKPEVQQARHDFIERYANFSPDWARQWEAEFKQWIN